MATHRDSDRFIVRLPDGMRDRIKEAAEANGRSMNAEIVHVLEEAFPDPLPDYRQLLKMVFEFLEESGAPEELNALSRDIEAKISELPQEQGEELALKIANPILDAAEAKLKQFRATQKSPDTPNLDRALGRRKIDTED